jgi:transposase-like protein
MPKSKRYYPAKLKFQAVLELLKGHRTAGQIARAYRIHPNSYGQHPERFVHGLPRPPAPPREVWINKPTTGTAALIVAPQGLGVNTDLATACRTNDLELGRGRATPEREEIPTAVAQ